MPDLQASTPEHVVHAPSHRLVTMVTGVVFLALISSVSWLLFRDEGTPLLFSDLQQSEERSKTYNTLTIAYDQPLPTYEPTTSDLVSRGYLVNFYEGLVRFDRNLNLEPALALSWGMVSDTVWQFKLRPNVSFHDGSSFEASDVVASVERARLPSIDRIQTVDDLTVRFYTREPDPILPNKLTLLFMTPADSPPVVRSPVGTGPYAFERREGDTLHLTRFAGYWGDRPPFPKAELQSVPDKFERYESFLAGDIDVLAQVPPVFVEPLLMQQYLIASQPSLEVNFLLFDWKNPESSLRHRELREALRYAFDFKEFERMTGGFAHPAGQFVSRGILGYNPALDLMPYDPEKARGLLRGLPENLSLTVDLPEGVEAFGAYIEQQLKAIGIQPAITFWDADEYQDLVSSGRGEVFFFGWRSELGDAGDFFTNLVRQRYADNGMGELIADMERNVFESLRTEQLQKLMTTVVEEEIIGIPLFETDVLVGIQPTLEWEPRIDNLIFASDFH